MYSTKILLVFGYLFEIYTISHGEFPWAVQLTGCTGSILNRNWVLTAKHCVAERGERATEKDPDPQFVSAGITVGTNNLHDTNLGRKYKPLRLYLHPDVDLALVKIEPMDINDDVRGVCLPARNQPGLLEQNVWLSGFGMAGSRSYGHLYKKEVKVNAESENGWSTNERVIGGGDSGSPVSHVRRGDGKFYQYGWIIWGRGGGRVAPYISWIEQTIRKNDEYICKTCPRDWTQYRNKCFKMSEVRRNYPNAQRICQNEFAGDLISIRSEEEQRFFEHFMKIRRPDEISNFGFIGGQGSKANGFTWDDKRIPMNYTNWDHNQPDNMGVSHAPANCMAVLLSEPGDPWKFGKWHDLECEYEHHFACQRVL